MEKTIDFGKIDFYGTGKKINSVDVEIELKDNGRFSVCGDIWNNKHTNIIVCGQCLDEMLPFFSHNELFKKIYKFWKLYHLNDSHAGTPEQEAVVERWLKRTKNKYDYEKVCTYLKHRKMYKIPAKKADPYRKKDSSKIGIPFEYGTEWLFWEIPEEDKTEIQKLLADEIV